MKERPILFNGAMVRALLDGSKTQTRRAFNTRMIDLMYIAGHAGEVSYFVEKGFMEPNDASYVLDFCPFGQIGDRLWVRETFQPTFSDGREHGENTPDWETGEGYSVKYPATDEIIEWIDGDDKITSRCKPGMHMPRWASRIQLEITDVRVERLKSITNEDSICEGAKFTDFGKDRYGEQCDGWRCDRAPRSASDALGSARSAYANIWESINGAGSWNTNPWVWCISFKQVTK